MRKAGSKEVKQHWSAYVRRVARGEHVLVTVRGRPVLEMRPVDQGDDATALRAEAIVRGDLIPARKTGNTAEGDFQRFLRRRRPPVLTSKEVEEAVEWVRGERL
jgi:antitoxin (DNA-binding transcriptional repressor) of toxin-antitoxin stability system